MPKTINNVAHYKPLARCTSSCVQYSSVQNIYLLSSKLGIRFTLKIKTNNVFIFDICSIAGSYPSGHNSLLLIKFIITCKLMTGAILPGILAEIFHIGKHFKGFKYRLSNMPAPFSKTPIRLIAIIVNCCLLVVNK